MAAHLRVCDSFRSAILVIHEVQCRPRERGVGGEERSATHDIVFPRRGAFVRHDPSGELLADHASVLLFNARQPYRVSHPIEGGDDCTVLAYNHSTLLSALSLHDPAAADRPELPFRRAAFVPTPRTLAWQRALRRYARSPDADPLVVEEESLHLLGQLAPAITACDRPPRRRLDTDAAHRDAATAVRALLARRYSENLPLSALAEAVYLSPFHLARVFRAQTGVAIHQMRLRLRLAAALDRLLAGERDLTRLALELGFAHHSHFTRVFSRAVGAPPSALRRSAGQSQLSTFVQAARHLRS